MERKWRKVLEMEKERENDERMRKWKGNGEKMRKCRGRETWRENKKIERREQKKE